MIDFFDFLKVLIFKLIFCKYNIMRKMNLLIQLILLLTCFSISAKEIDTLTARKIAINFYLKEHQISSLTNLTAGNISCNIISENNSKGSFYIFDISGNSFVIVSGDDAAIPILGYSFETGFDPPGISYQRKPIHAY